MKTLRLYVVAVIAVVFAVSSFAQSAHEQQEMMMKMMEMMQKMQGSQDGYSAEIQKSRIEQREFEDLNKLRAIGIGESRDEALAKDIAEQNARAAMQRNIEAFTKDALDRYRKQVTMDDAESYEARDENLSTTVAKGILTGCRKIDTAKYYNKDTKKYKFEVLVEYDKAGVIGIIASQDAKIEADRDRFAAKMQEVFDEYDLEKTGETAAMRKAKAANAMEQDNLDRETERSMKKEQQKADNDQRRRDAENETVLKRDAQRQETQKEMHRTTEENRTKRNYDRSHQ